MHKITFLSDFTLMFGSLNFTYNSLDFNQEIYREFLYHSYVPYYHGSYYLFNYPSTFIFRVQHSRYLSFEFFNVDIHAKVNYLNHYTIQHVTKGVARYKRKEFYDNIWLYGKGEFDVKSYLPKQFVFDSFEYIFFKSYRTFGYFSKFDYKFFHNFIYFWDYNYFWKNFYNISSQFFEWFIFSIYDIKFFYNFYDKLNFFEWNYWFFFYDSYFFDNLYSIVINTYKFFIGFFYVMFNHYLSFNFSIFIFSFQIKAYIFFYILYFLFILNIFLFIFHFLMLIRYKNNFNFFVSFYKQIIYFIPMVYRFICSIFIRSQTYYKRNSVTKIGPKFYGSPVSLLYRILSLKNYLIYERSIYFINQFWFYNFIHIIYLFVFYLSKLRYIIRKSIVFHILKDAIPFYRFLIFVFSKNLFFFLFNLIWYFVHYLHLLIVQFLLFENNFNIANAITPKGWKIDMPTENEEVNAPTLLFLPFAFNSLSPFFSNIIDKLKPLYFKLHFFFEKMPLFSSIGILKLIFILFIKVINFILLIILLLFFNSWFFIGFISYSILRLKFFFINCLYLLNRFSIYVFLKRIIFDFFLFFISLLKLFKYFFKPIEYFSFILWNIYLFLSLLVFNLIKINIKLLFNIYNFIFRRSIFITFFVLFFFYNLFYYSDPVYPILYFFLFCFDILNYGFIEPMGAWSESFYNFMYNGYIYGLTDYDIFRSRVNFFNHRKLVRAFLHAALKFSKTHTSAFSPREIRMIKYVLFKLECKMYYQIFVNKYVDIKYVQFWRLKHLYFFFSFNYIYGWGNIYKWIVYYIEFFTNYLNKISLNYNYIYIIDSKNWIKFLDNIIDFKNKLIFKFYNKIAFLFLKLIKEDYIQMKSGIGFKIFPKLEYYYLDCLSGGFSWFFYYYFLDFFYTKYSFINMLFSVVFDKVWHHTLFYTYIFLEKIWYNLYFKLILFKLNFFPLKSDINLLNNLFLNTNKNNNKQHIVENWDWNLFGFFMHDFHYKSTATFFTYNRFNFYDKFHMYFKLRGQAIENYKANYIFGRFRILPGPIFIPRFRPMYAGNTLFQGLINPYISSNMRQHFYHNSYYLRSSWYSIFDLWSFPSISLEESISFDKRLRNTRSYVKRFFYDEAHMSIGLLAQYYICYWLPDFDYFYFSENHYNWESGYLHFSPDSIDGNNVILPYTDIVHGPWIANTYLWALFYPMLIPFFCCFDAHLRKIFFPSFTKHDFVYDLFKFRNDKENNIEILKDLAVIDATKDIKLRHLIFLLKKNKVVYDQIKSKIDIEQLQKDLNVELIEFPLFFWNSGTLNRTVFSNAHYWDKNENLFFYVKRLIKEQMPEGLKKYQLLSLLHILSLTKQEQRLWNVIFLGREHFESHYNMKKLEESILTGEADNIYKEILKTGDNNILLLFMKCLFLNKKFTGNLNAIDFNNIRDLSLNNLLLLLEDLRKLFFKYTTPSFFLILFKNQINPLYVDFTSFCKDPFFSEIDNIYNLNYDSLNAFRHYALNNDKLVNNVLLRNMHSMPMWGESFLEGEHRDYIFDQNLEELFKASMETNDLLESYFLKIEKEFFNFDSPQSFFPKRNIHNKIFLSDPTEKDYIKDSLKMLNNFSLKKDNLKLYDNLKINIKEKTKKNNLKNDNKKLETNTDNLFDEDINYKNFIKRNKMNYLPHYFWHTSNPLYFYAVAMSMSFFNIYLWSYNSMFSISRSINVWHEFLFFFDNLLVSNDYCFVAGQYIYFSNEDMIGIEGFDGKRQFRKTHRRYRSSFRLLYEIIYYDNNYFFRQYPRISYRIYGWSLYNVILKYFYNFIFFDGINTFDSGFLYLRLVYIFKFLLFIISLVHSFKFLNKNFKWIIYGGKVLGNRFSPYYSKKNIIRLDVFFSLKQRLSRNIHFFFGNSRKT